jgi:hypothetical protein
MRPAAINLRHNETILSINAVTTIKPTLKAIICYNRAPRLIHQM